MAPPADPLRAAALLRGLIAHLEGVDEPTRMKYLGRIADRVTRGFLPIMPMHRLFRLAQERDPSAYEHVMNLTLRTLIVADSNQSAQAAHDTTQALRFAQAVFVAQRFLLRLVTLTEKEWNPSYCDADDVETLVQTAFDALTSELGDTSAAAEALTELLGLLYPANDTGETALVPVFPEV